MSDEFDPIMAAADARDASDEAARKQLIARHDAIVAIYALEARTVSTLDGARIMGMVNLATAASPVYGARVRGTRPDAPLSVGESALIISQSGRLFLACLFRGDDGKVRVTTRPTVAADLLLEDAEAYAKALRRCLEIHVGAAEQRGAAFDAVSEFSRRLAAVVLAAALVVIGACSSTPLPGPTVYVALGGDSAGGVTGSIAQTSWNAFDSAQVELAAQDWRHLGYDVQPIGMTGTDGPTITIHADWGYASSNIGSSSTQAVGLSWGDAYIDADLHGDALRGYAAHEIGHLLLHTDQNMPTGGRGVMTVAPSSWDVTRDDLSFACEVRSRCDWYDDAE